MKLKRLHIENFGTLHDFRMDLSDGMNVLHRENGWGKSTLAVFIKAMFYGLPASTRRSLDENERRKYAPWQGGAYGGSLEFETAHGSFRIERYFGAKETADTCALYDLSTNRPTTVYREPIGESLFGIDADGFERTVYLSQRAESRGDNSSIAARLGNLLDDVDDIGSFDDAVEALEKRRKYYVMTGNRGRIADLEGERTRLQNELETLERTRAHMDALEREMATRAAQIKDVRAELAGVRADLKKAGLVRERAAHLEENARREGELRTLRASIREIDASFGGSHPTEEELLSADASLRRMQQQRASAEAISLERAPVRTELLSAAYFDKCPGEDLLDRMAKSNGRLQELTRHRTREQDAADAELMRRFSNGAPDEDRISAAYAALEKAQKGLEASAARQRETRPKSVVLPWILGAVGALLLALCTIPVLAPMLYLFLGLGGALVIAAPIIGGVGRVRARRIAETALREAQAARQKHEETLASVRRFLASYGARGEDLGASLSELSFAVRQYREALLRRERHRAETASVEAELRQLLSFLLPSFGLFGLRLSQKEDYRDEIEALRRDIRLVAQDREQTASLSASRAEALQRAAREKEALRAIVARYDAAWEADPAAALRRLRERESEYRRLCGELERRQTALAAFRLEKRLDGAPDGAEMLDFDALSSQESTLQATLDELTDAQNRVSHEIDLLSQDADRIPELCEALSRLSDELETAQANSRTVATTMRLLEESKTALSTRYLDGMQKSFARFLGVLTSDEAPESVMDPSFEVSLREGGRTHSMESFSRGWRDAVRFCVRLSLADALYTEGEKPFLLLDDPFVNLDDTRLAAARRLLEMLSREYQILYMVCHADRR